MRPTLDQAFQLLSIIRESGVSLEQVQKNLFNTGLFSNLLKAENLEELDRETVRLAFGYEPSLFRVQMGALGSTTQITATIEHEYGFLFNPMINQENFPLSSVDEQWKDVLELFTPGVKFTSERGLALLNNEGFDRPTFEHALRYAQQYGAITSDKTPDLVFLHEPWRDPEGHNRIICVQRGSKYSKKLHLEHSSIRTFGEQDTLVGVRRERHGRTPTQKVRFNRAVLTLSE